MPGFRIDVEDAAQALKNLIDELDADSIADLFSHAYGVECLADSKGMMLEVQSTSPDAFLVAKDNFERAGFSVIEISPGNTKDPDGLQEPQRG